MYVTNKVYQVNEKAAEFQHQFGECIVDLLGQVNQTYLNGKGKLLPQPAVEQNIMRWTLAWVQDKVAFDLNIIVNLGRNGRQAYAESVFVHRHASTPYDYEEHTPTTRIRRLVGFSITAIQEAIEAEFAQDRLKRKR